MSEILKEAQQSYLDSLLPESIGFIAEMEDYAAAHGIPILDRHASAFLGLLIKIKKPEAVLEIGTAIGYTTIRVASILSDRAFIDTIEKSAPNIALAKDYFHKSGVSEKIKLIQGDALEILKSIQTKYDLIFLDADKEDYKSLFDLALPLLRDGGIIVIDNLLWHGYAASDEVPEKFKRSAQIIREFNSYITNLEGLAVSILPVGDGIGIVTKDQYQLQ